MRLVLTGETEQRLEMRGEELEIVSEGGAISPYHLLAGSLATCIGMLAGPRSRQVNADLDDLVIFVSCEHEEEEGAGEGRVRRMEVRLEWPGLPEGRGAALERLARACPLHETLEGGTEVVSGYGR